MALIGVLAVGAGVVAVPATATSPAAGPAAGHQRGASATRTVSAPGARAVIHEHPFRITFETGQGRPVLSESANTNQAPLAEPETNDPVAPGYDNQSTTSLDAPLSFLVGTEVDSQQTSGEWIGNLQAGTREGTLYSARDVKGVTPHGRGLRIVLSTSDPTGRTLVVTVGPRGSHAMHVTVRPNPAVGVAEVGDSFASSTHESFSGFGGRHDTLDQHGQVLSSFVNEENLAGTVGPARGPGGLSMFPNGPDAAYYPQAEFYSSRPYGFLLDQPQLARFTMDVAGATNWNVMATAQRLSYVVAPGSAARSVRTITSISGRQPVPPKWALGPMLDRLVKNEGESYSDYEGNLEADLRNIAKYHLPLTAYRIEGWGFASKDNDGLALHTWVHPALQRKIVAELRKRHIHALFYLRPWLSVGSTPVTKGYAVRTASGKPYYVVGSGGSRFALVDFTNPAAVRWWQHEVAKIFNLGADGFMQDYGEQVLFDMHFHNGATGVTEHDAYLTQYVKATRDEITKYEKKHPHRRPWFFNRAGYSGAPGSAKYEGGNFPGDETTDWGHASGIKSLAPDMLNRAVGGAYGYGTDIGGYLDYTTPPTSKELFLRWAEWAALSPIFRLHGTGLAGTHVPWSYDRQTVRIYNRLSRLHEKAAPLIRRLWRTADRTGMPVTRPLWLQFPHDGKARGRDQEWMLGPDVLVAPVVTKGAATRRVYLPPGCWTTTVHGHQRRYRGSRDVTVPAPLATLPYFTKCGTHPLA